MKVSGSKQSDIQRVPAHLFQSEIIWRETGSSCINKKITYIKKGKIPKTNPNSLQIKTPRRFSEKLCFKYTDLKKKKSKEHAVLQNSSSFCLCFHFRKQMLIDSTVGGVSHRDSNSQKMATGLRDLSTTNRTLKGPSGNTGHLPFTRVTVQRHTNFFSPISNIIHGLQSICLLNATMTNHRTFKILPEQGNLTGWGAGGIGHF